MEDSAFSGLGWAPAFYAFTNIENGLGLMGTVCIWDSGWPPNKFEDEPLD